MERAGRAACHAVHVLGLFCSALERKQLGGHDYQCPESSAANTTGTNEVGDGVVPPMNFSSSEILQDTV